jgi:hypothetical protein
MSFLPSSGADGKVTRGNLTEASVDIVDYLHKIDMYNEYINVYQEDKTIINWLESTKRELVSDETNYFHFEKDWINPAIVIVAKDDGSGSSVVLTVDEDSAVRLTNLVFFGKGELYGYVTAISAPSGGTIDVTVVPAGSYNLQTGVSDGDYFNAYSNAQKEASSSMTSLNSRPLMYSGKVQIIRSGYIVTGSEATNKVTIKLQNGSEFYTTDQELNEHIRFKQAIANALLINPNVSSLSDAGGNNIRVTKGLIQTIRDRGVNYATPTTWSVNDFYNLTIALDKVRGAKENLFYYGNQLGISIDQAITNTMQNGGIQYNAFGAGNDKQKAIDLGFNSIKVGNYTFHLSGDASFNDPQLLAMAGSTYPNKGYIVPADSQNDAVSGAKVPSLMLRYKASPSENRKYKKYELTINDNGVDQIEKGELTECGLQVMGAKRMVIIE